MRLPRIPRGRYDLEIVGCPCYFVEGFLVHNSHADLRIIDPEGRGHSWAIPQAQLPEPGKNAFGFRVETHSKEYSLKGPKDGRIPKGSYGAGRVTQLLSEPIEVTEANDRHLRFNLYSGKAPQEFFMKRMGQKRWLIRNVTPTETLQRWQGVIPHDRPPAKERPLDSINPSNEGTLLQPKVDGAHGIVVLEGGRPVRVFSYRKGAKGLIEHTHKFPEYGRQIVPEDLGQTVLRAEIGGVDKKGRPLPAERIGGLLNASVWKSRAMQEAADQKLRLYAFKPIRFDGKKVKARPYLDQLQMLETVHEQVPMIRVMPTAQTPAAKEKMLQSIRSGTNPLTDEGVMEIDAQTGALTKGKAKSTFDVYVRDVVPGKREGDAGAIRFSWTPRGEVVGRVGTGFSEDLRQKMLAHPDQYLGRVAKVTAQKKYPSGALRAPVFREWHIDKGRTPIST